MILPIFVGEIEMKLPVLIDILISNGDSGDYFISARIDRGKGQVYAVAYCIAYGDKYVGCSVLCSKINSHY